MTLSINKSQQRKPNKFIKPHVNQHVKYLRLLLYFFFKEEYAAPVLSSTSEVSIDEVGRFVYCILPHGAQWCL